ncbi:calmodulin-like protein 3 [Magnolia sinica]|uniref:calmodulin-like protein 3 n=1 Tax=Magnolia sinica TaxID=86752 RepID=UPI002659D4FA|nr:calmodulin-like protein 3 [Magnolia sinica]
MPTVLMRIFHLYNLLNSILLYFFPKRIASLIPFSWITKTHQGNLHQMKETQSSPSISIAPRMDPAELRRVFQMFDRNGDGRITQHELNDSLENLGIYIPDKDLMAMIEKIDENGDGCVDITEFGALYRTIMNEKDEDEDMREAFNVFDQNGDGFINVEELRSVLGSLGIKQGQTVEDCKKMIMNVDGDGDGMVNFKEFKKMMRGGGFATLSGK